jgi:hypothetical protein
LIWDDFLKGDHGCEKLMGERRVSRGVGLENVKELFGLLLGIWAKRSFILHPPPTPENRQEIQESEKCDTMYLIVHD